MQNSRTLGAQRHANICAHTHDSTLCEIPISEHSSHASQRFRLHFIAHSTLRDAHQSQSHLLSVLSNILFAFGITDESEAVLCREIYLRELFFASNQKCN